MPQDLVMVFLKRGFHQKKRTIIYFLNRKPQLSWRDGVTPPP